MEGEERERWQEEPLSEPGEPVPESREPGSGKLRRIVGATPFMMTMVALLLIALGALSWYAAQWKRGVRVEQVIVSGADLVSAAELDKRLERFGNQPLEKIRIDEVQRSLASEPWIRSMTISKELNGILRVVIEERRPVALLVDGARQRVIDAEGFVLPDKGVANRYQRLVKVSGAVRLAPAAPGSGASRLNDADSKLLLAMLDAFAEMPHAGLLLSEIHLAPDNKTWFSVAGSPIRFLVGNSGNFKEKLKKFEIFWQQVVAKKGIDCYKSVDLRFRDRVFASEPEQGSKSAAP